MTPEGKVKSKVTDLLLKYCAYYFKPTTGGYGRSGVPDIVGCVNGKFFAIECKAGNNQPTLLQTTEMENIRLHKGVAFVINESNLQLLEDWLLEQAKDNSQYVPTEKMTVPAMGRLHSKRIKVYYDSND